MIGGEIEIMKNLYFYDFEDFSCVIADTYDSLKGKDYEDVAIIAKYEEARQIIKELLCIGYDIHSINIIDEEYGEYDAEYIIYIYDDEIWCEPMLRESGYIEDDAPVIYVLDECSGCACKKDEKPTTTSTTSKSIYKINNKTVSKEEFDKKYEEFEEKYLDNIHDMILSYCEFMDKANEWRKWFR